MNTISCSSLSAVPDPFLLDVRSPAEFQQAHIPGSTLHPLAELDPARITSLAAGRKIFLVCQSGNRARQAFEKLSKAGLREVTVVEGGISVWEQAGLPLNKDRKSISLERQVRIAAGLIVLAGVIAGWIIHPLFHGLAAFVGAGLVFAGLTDTCGMGLLLTKMPWNRRSCTTGACAVKHKPGRPETTFQQTHA